MMPTMKTLLIFHMWIDSGAFSGSAYQTCTYHINRQGCLKEAQQMTQNTIKGTKSTLIFFFMFRMWWYIAIFMHQVNFANTLSKKKIGLKRVCKETPVGKKIPVMLNKQANMPPSRNKRYFLPTCMYFSQ